MLISVLMVLRPQACDQKLGLKFWHNSMFGTAINACMTASAQQILLSLMIDLKTLIF